MKEKLSPGNLLSQIFLKDKRRLTLVILLIAFSIIMSMLSPRNFPTTGNLRSMMHQMSETGLFTLAMFLIMISGGFNLSSVAIANLAGACMAMITTGGFLGDVLTTPTSRIVCGILAALLVGVLAGLVNGFFVSKLALNALLVTTASAQLFEGASRLLTKGGSIVNNIPAIVEFGAGAVFNVVPYVFIVTMICFAAAGLFANYTKYGEASRLLGANETANIYCGNNNVRTLMAAYILSGIISAIGGMVVFSKMGIVRSEYGSTLGSQALLTLVFAGMLVIGGTGKITNVLLALCILQVVGSGFNLAGISNYLRNTCWGILLISIVVLNTPFASRQSEKIKGWVRKTFRKKAVQKSD